MNRRSFFTKLVKATAAFSILPSAETYKRIWVYPNRIINPEWVIAEREVHWLFNSAALQGTWKWFDLSNPPPNGIPMFRSETLLSWNGKLING